jgi:hypothetical protein
MIWDIMCTILAGGDLGHEFYTFTIYLTVDQIELHRMIG